MNPAMHSSKSNDHRTPGYFLDLVREVAPIAYDPASQKGNPTKARVSFSYQDEEGNAWTAASDGSRCIAASGGLSQYWPMRGLTYVNPPYGRHLGGPVDESAEIRKTVKCERSFAHGPDRSEDCAVCDKTGRISILVGKGTGWANKMAQHKGEGLYLVASRTDAGWFKRLHRWCAWRLDWSSPILGHRLRFGDSKDSAPFPSTVFYRGPNVSRFLDTFGPHGTLLPGPKTQEALVRAAMGGGA